jgi:hypothetical protein
LNAERNPSGFSPFNSSTVFDFERTPLLSIERGRAFINSSGDKVSQSPKTRGFCKSCSDWIVDEGWQEDGTYFCPTCLEFRNVELVWRQNEGLVQDTTEKFS